MWAHDAQAHMLVLPAQTANSEDRVRTSRGTRVERFGTTLVLLEQRMERLKDGFGLEDDDLSLDLGSVREAAVTLLRLLPAGDGAHCAARRPQVRQERLHLALGRT